MRFNTLQRVCFGLGVGQMVNVYVCKASFEKVQLEQSEEFEGNEGSEPW